MVGGLATNNKAAEQYKAGLKPLLIDTYENTVPITGNYFAKASADRQASNLTSLAARPRTSDASLQLAGELEAQNKAGDIRFQGDMADADMFYKTRMMAQQESDAAKLMLPIEIELRCYKLMLLRRKLILLRLQLIISKLLILTYLALKINSDRIEQLVNNTMLNLIGRGYYLQCSHNMMQQFKLGIQLNSNNY